MGNPSGSIRLCVTQLPVCPSFEALLAGLGERRGLLALDSAAGEPQEWSWIAFEPEEFGRQRPSSMADLRSVLAEAPEILADAVPGPFRGGFMGAVTYDSGVPGERQELPSDPWFFPPVVGGIYTSFFVFDHREGRVSLVVPEGVDPSSLLAIAHGAADGATHARGAFLCSTLERQTSSSEHQARIEQARSEIAQGEYYQANLAHAFEGPTQGDPLDLYLELRRVNPAPYMAYLRFHEGALLSASPELLIQVDGTAMLTRPIKGTAPRSADPELDGQLRDGLLASEKDRAELAMIVDLLRNDLGRVAEVGSVRVSSYPELRSYAGVHHLMADVSAVLAAGRSSIDALCSVFPGGSITGAPKLRSMQAIGELEGEGRGFFTGSAGFLDATGNARFNILIRTLQWRPLPLDGGQAGRVRFHVGGGITWSSNAQDEDRETLVKGARLAEALGNPLPMDLAERDQPQTQ